MMGIALILVVLSICLTRQSEKVFEDAKHHLKKAEQHLKEALQVLEAADRRSKE